MRMGFVIQRWKVRNPPPYTEVEPKYIEVAVRRDSRVLPSKPVRKFEDSRFQVFTGLPITYKFSSFHWSPHNLSFHGSPQIFSHVFTEVNGSPARRHLCIFSLYLCIQRWISHFPPLYDKPHSHRPDSDKWT